ncbi:hypothetical protein MRB53_015881 [Persea americana]|uniref:Uncharacterized protein n=1 Tax=Persea americana TaxID=3435 RepID=A0ACC2M0I3_PERAE|nr:hypothetical protein MRB53_015881 [Persea americana]
MTTALGCVLCVWPFVPRTSWVSSQEISLSLPQLLKFLNGKDAMILSFPEFCGPSIQIWLQAFYREILPKIHILLIEPFPSINKVYALVSQEEKQRELYLSHLPSTEATALATKKVSGFDTRRRSGKGGNNGIPHSTKNCHYYHRDGHTIEKCYKLHGYPPCNPAKPSPNHPHPVNTGKPPHQHQHHANHTASANAQFPATSLQDVDSLLSALPN